MNLGSFKNVKKDLALNNLKWLICHKTKPDQTKSCQLHFPVFHSFCDKFYDFAGYFEYFEKVYYLVLRDHEISLFAVNLRYGYIFRLALLLLRNYYYYIII